MSSESDSDEFFDAPDSQNPRKSSQQTVEKAKNKEVDTLELELKQLETEKQEAEERRRQEDELLQEKLRELEKRRREIAEEEKKRLEEERLKREEEELKWEKEQDELERRKHEEEERRKEQLETDARLHEAEKRRKRLEQIRDNGEGGSLEELPTPDDATEIKDEEKGDHVDSSSNFNTESRTIFQSEKEEMVTQVKTVETMSRCSPEPDVVAMTKTGLKSMPPPVAPPRKKKKKKTRVDGLQKPDTLSIDSFSISSVTSIPGDSYSLNDDIISVGAGLPSEKQSNDMLTPTTTIESITKELEHSLDLASAAHGGGVVFHLDTQSIKGESKSVVEKGGVIKDGKPEDRRMRKNTPDTETIFQYHNLMQGKSVKGDQMADEEILALVMVKNLDTGEKVSLLKAEEKLPQCVNPLSLHIMRLTSEYVSNSSLDKDDESDEDKEDNVSTVSKVKKKRKKLKKFISKTAHKIKVKADEQFHREEEVSEEESLPDVVSVKFKASSSNKGPYDFDQVKVAQDMSGEHTGAVWTMQFSHCGRLLATGGQDHLLRVWVLKDHFTYFDDMRQKYSSHQQGQSDDATPDEAMADTANVEAEIEGVRFSEDEDQDGGNDYSADDHLSVFAPSPFCTYTGHTADLLDISWSKNYFILSSSMDKMVRLWHISRTECLCCFQHIDFVTAIAFHPKDDRYFLSGSLDGKIRLWNIPDKRVALWNEIDGPTKLITAANFIQNGRFSVVGTYDGRCIFFDTEHLKYYTQIHVRSTRGRNSKGRKITAIEPVPGQDKILVTSNDSRIRLYDLRDLSLACKFKGALNLSSQIKASFSHNYRYIISGSEDHCIYIWKTSYDFAKFTSVRRDRNDYWESLKAHDAVVTAVVFSPNPSLVLQGQEEMRLNQRESSREKLDTKLNSNEDKSEKRSSLKKDHSEVIVSADFSGTIKAFIRQIKEQ